MDENIVEETATKEKHTLVDFAQSTLEHLQQLTGFDTPQTLIITFVLLASVVNLGLTTIAWSRYGVKIQRFLTKTAEQRAAAADQSPRQSVSNHIKEE